MQMYRYESIGETRERRDKEGERLRKSEGRE